MTNQITVPVLTASAVADHYGLDARALRRWIRRNQNVRLLGTLDSPAINQLVDRFKLCGPWDNRELQAAYALNAQRGVLDTPSGQWAPHVFHIVNEYRGRGLAKEKS